MKTQELLYTDAYLKEYEKRAREFLPMFEAGLAEIEKIEDPKVKMERFILLCSECFLPETESEKVERAKREMQWDIIVDRYHDVLGLVLDGDLKVFKKLSVKKKD
jgi:hypothetical protein